MKTLTAPKTFLDLIPGRHSYTIAPVSGKQTIMKTEFYHEPAQSVYLTLRFHGRPSLPKKATEVIIFRLNPKEFGPHIILRKLFNAINENLEELCLTEHQIISFVQLQPEFLADENVKTLFLLKGEKDFSIACAESYFHHSGPIKLVPMDISETLYAERFHLNLVIPRDSTINIIKT